MTASDPGAWPQIDFASFGAIEIKPLPRIQKLAATFLTRNSALIPHVTHQDDADVTALEATRKSLSAQPTPLKLTPLAFLVKAAAGALQAHPQFNASLDAAASSVVYKKYFNVGIAIEVAGGLLVAVLRQCDRKSVAQLAGEITAVSDKARTKGLSLAEMSGGCFTISSLGAIGGTGFTPIINAPEVAILGVSKSQWKATRGDDDQVVWRLMMPLSLSYDHRLINGADAARFTRTVAGALADPQQLMSLE